MKSSESMKSVKHSCLSLSWATLTVAALGLGFVGSQASAATDTTGVLNIHSTASLDMTNNKLIVLTPGGANTDPSAISTFGPNSASYSAIFGYVTNGFNGGAWTGASGAIRSSTAAADAAFLTAIGIVQNNSTTTNYSSFGGVALTPGVGSGTGQALLKYTYYGDANLDGAVTGSDYIRIDNAFATGGLFGWFNGDFNYDGSITGADYIRIDNAFASQGAPFPFAGDSGKSSSTGGGVVPEPGSVALLIAGALGILARRRRLQPSF